MDNLNRITSLVEGAVWRARRIAAPLGNALFFSAADERISFKKELCVSIEKGGVSVAYGTRFLSSISIKGARHYPFKDTAYPQPKEVASAIILAVNELGVSVKSLTLGIPKALAAVKIAEFPSTARNDISNVITYELDRLLPFSPESTMYDFMIAGETAEKMTVAVAAAKSDIIEAYREAIRETGSINVGRVTLNITAAGELCRSVSGLNDFIFAAADEAEYEAALFLGGRLYRVISDSLAGAEVNSKSGKIAAGLKSLFEIAKKREKSLRPAVFIHGSGPALIERLKADLGLPVSKLEGHHALPDGPSIAAGCVLESLRPGAARLDLLSRGIHKKLSRPKAPSIILTLLLISCLVLSAIAPIRFETKRLSAIERQIKIRKSGMKDLDKLKQEIDEEKDRIDTVTKFKEGSPATLSILKELTQVLPKPVWLTRVKIDRASVDIEGYANSASELLSRLEASRYFRKAEFSSPTFRDIRMNSDRFSIKMEIKGVIQDEKGAKKGK